MTEELEKVMEEYPWYSDPLMHELGNSWSDVDLLSQFDLAGQVLGSAGILSSWYDDPMFCFRQSGIAGSLMQQMKQNPRQWAELMNPMYDKTIRKTGYITIFAVRKAFRKRGICCYMIFPTKDLKQ